MESKSSSYNGRSSNNNSNNNFSEKISPPFYPTQQIRQNYNALNPNPNPNPNSDRNLNNYNSSNSVRNYNRGYGEDNNDLDKKRRINIFRDGMSMKVMYKKVKNKL